MINEVFTMALPRPGRVQRIPEAAPTGRETLPQIEEQEEKAPSLGPIPPVLGHAAPALSPSFRGRAQPIQTEEPPPWATEDAAGLNDEPEVEIIQPQPPMQPYVPQRPVATEPAMPVPYTQPPSAVTQVMQSPTNISAALASMGFEGLELGSGFGAFPTVTLKDEMFSTSDGDKLGESFACVLHDSRPKWIVKSSDSKDSEFKYSYDKVNDTSGRPLETIFKIWRAQGLMQGDPVYRAYLDVTAQIVDVNKKELGQIVMLQIPQTSIERLKGYVTNLVLAKLSQHDVITQVYLGQKVTSVKHPFWPWAFRRWALLSQLGM